MSARLSHPSSFRNYHPDCSQEAGSVPVRDAAKMQVMKQATAASLDLRIDPRPMMLSRRLLPFILLVVQWMAARVHLQAAVVATPRVTLIVFADKLLPEEEWKALSAALANGFGEVALDARLLPAAVEVVRGESLAPGMQFDSAIPIFLHGSCRLVALPGQPDVRGALGWVLRDGREIKPFIHVDCERIAELLGQRAVWMNRANRNAAMAEAISRVVLHEWIHIVTQHSGHDREGISKRAFGVADLIPDYAPRTGHADHGR